MIRRDEVVEKLGKFNSTKVINESLDSLEKFIDTELQKEENIRKWINLSNVGATTSGGLEVVNLANITDDVHKDLTVQGDEKVTITKDSGDKVAYTIFKDDITTAGGADATTTPWNDRTVAQGVFNGIFSIKCPEGTNKNVAKVLADRYMAIDKTDSNGDPISGYWSNAVKPNNEDNENDSGDVLSDAVTITYDQENDIVYMNFKLF